MSKRKTVVPTANYLLQYLQEDAAFLLQLAEHAYLLAKGWHPVWRLPYAHPNRYSIKSEPYETTHAVNSQKYYERNGRL